MKNKRLTIILIILIFLTVFVVLSSAIFSLKIVELNFLSDIDVLTGQEEHIIDGGNFRYNENIFFSNKTNYVNNLEKNNPYLKVINLETKFPNKILINAVERNECFVIKLSNNKYAVVDEDMKVLKLLDVYNNTTSNGIAILNSELKEQLLTDGDFFDVSNDYYKVLFDSFREWKDSYEQIKQKVESIELNYNKTDQLLIKMRSGVKILLQKSSNQMSDKTNYAFSIYDTTEINGEAVDYTQNGTIYIYETLTEIKGSYIPD